MSPMSSNSLHVATSLLRHKSIAFKYAPQNHPAFHCILQHESPFGSEKASPLGLSKK